MVKKFLAIALFIPLLAPAQESSDKYYIHEGLFCVRGSLAYGNMVSLKSNHIYLVGGVEYFVNDRISLSGDSYFFVNSFNGNKPFDAWHSTFAGALFHLPVKGQTNIYFGLQPGVNFGKAVDPCLGQPCLEIVYPEEPGLTISPVASGVLGLRYFGTKWFHLNIDTRYIAGNFMDNYNRVSMGEWRLSFSLGFNFN